MDFARKQLEKYGWSDGKGLGKHENGIAQPLKPKLKRSVAGLGHDAAADFTEHWWTQLYDKAAGNVEVEEKNGKTKKIKTKDTDDFEITNSTWKLKKKKKMSDDDQQYSEFFIKKAVLTKGVSKIEKTEIEESDEEAGVKKDVFKMTDEELFAACEGRTAHKGARHGIKATGKLARIAQQEQILLAQSQYEGYSHAKKRKSEQNLYLVNSTNEVNSNELSTKKQKKKKNKNSEESAPEISLPADSEKSGSDSATSNNKKHCHSRKSNNIENQLSDADNISEENATTVVKKKKKKHKSNIDKTGEGDFEDNSETIVKKEI